MERLTRRRSVMLLVSLLLLCLAVAGIGGASTAAGVREWYPTLDKPPWTPPSWVFGPVWTVLYTTMAVATWDVVRRAPHQAQGLLALFGVQLLLNATWSPIFFAARLPGAALLIIAGLWIAVAGCVVRYAPISRAAAAGMGLYLAWVTLAASLNAWIAWFN